MGILKDRTGEIVGKYKILYKEGLNKNHEMTYTVECLKCGFIVHGWTYAIIKKACNLKCRHVAIKRRYAANWHSKRLMSIYYGMLDRCNNSKSRSYYNYGARGIKVCDEWQNNPQSFNDWAINNGYDKTLTIDRIDNYDGYKPENCRWVTKSENSTHHRSTNYVTVNNITHTFPQWCKIIGLPKNRMWQIYNKYGMAEVERVISDYLSHGDKPKVFKYDPITVDGVTMDCTHWCRHLGIENEGYFVRYKAINGKEATARRIKEIMDDPSSYKSQVHDPKIITIDGVSKTLSQWCDDLGLTKSTMYYRYRKHPKKVTKLIHDKYHEMESNKGPLVIKLGNLKIGLG